MAESFDITAVLNIQGPTGIKPVIDKLKREVSGIKGNVDVRVDKKAVQNVRTLSSNLGNLDRTLSDVRSRATQANAALGGLNKTSSSVASGNRKIASSGKSAAKSLGQVKTEVDETINSLETFGRQSRLAIQRFTAFSLAAGALVKVVGLFREGTSEALSFQREVVRLSQVTKTSVESLSGLTNEITRLSTGLGVASSELIQVSRILTQAGFAANDTKTALEALARSSLAPTFTNIINTTEGAIAITRQFKIEANELEGALGSVNAVAGRFAVESDDLIAAVRRTGGAFQAAGGNLNELIALFTSVRSTTRESAESIATGFRTIFTRLQRISTINSLKDLGVQLQDVEGQFVGPFEAIKRLSEALSELRGTDPAFSSIIEELGGFRQVSKVIPLIKQFGTAQQALQVAQRGTTSLIEDANKAQDAYIVKLEKLRERFFAFIRSLGENSLIKDFGNILIQTGNAAITLAESLEPVLPLLLAVGAIKGTKAIGKIGGGFFGAEGGASKAEADQKAQVETRLATERNNELLARLTVTMEDLDRSLLRRKSLGFATGGIVPGAGNRDTVPANLTPGEFVIRKKAVEAIGRDKLEGINKFNKGGRVKFQNGGKATLDDVLIGNQDASKPTFGGLFLQPGKSGSQAFSDIKFRKLSEKSQEKIARNANKRGATIGPESSVRTAFSFGFTDEQFPDEFKKQSSDAFLDAIDNLVKAFNPFEDSLGPKGVSGLADAAGFGGAIGNLFEGFVSSVTKNIEGIKSGEQTFDFPSFSGESRNRAGKLFGDIPSSVRAADIKTSANTEALESLKKKSATDARDNEIAFAVASKKSAEKSIRTSGAAIPKKKALGGMTRGTDSVRALLTPGEFVINKKAADRLGTKQLDRLNRADKVQRFQSGGLVGSTGQAGSFIGNNAGNLAILGSIASSFIELEGTLGTLKNIVVSTGTTFAVANGIIKSLNTSQAKLNQEIGEAEKRFDKLAAESGLNNKVEQLDTGTRALGANQLQQQEVKDKLSTRRIAQAGDPTLDTSQAAKEKKELLRVERELVKEEKKLVESNKKLRNVTESMTKAGRREVEALQKRAAANQRLQKLVTAATFAASALTAMGSSITNANDKFIEIAKTEAEFDKARTAGAAGSALSGAGTGALAGASLASQAGVGPVGALIAGGIGGAIGALSAVISDDTEIKIAKRKLSIEVTALGKTISKLSSGNITAQTATTRVRSAVSSIQSNRLSGNIDRKTAGNQALQGQLPGLQQYINSLAESSTSVDDFNKKQGGFGKIVAELVASASDIPIQEMNEGIQATIDASRAAAKLEETTGKLSKRFQALTLLSGNLIEASDKLRNFSVELTAVQGTLSGTGGALTVGAPTDIFTRGNDPSVDLARLKEESAKLSAEFAELGAGEAGKELERLIVSGGEVSKNLPGILDELVAGGDIGTIIPALEAKLNELNIDKDVLNQIIAKAEDEDAKSQGKSFQERIKVDSGAVAKALIPDSINQAGQIANDSIQQFAEQTKRLAEIQTAAVDNFFKIANLEDARRTNAGKINKSRAALEGRTQSAGEILRPANANFAAGLRRAQDGQRGINSALGREREVIGSSGLQDADAGGIADAIIQLGKDRRELQSQFANATTSGGRATAQAGLAEVDKTSKILTGSLQKLATSADQVIAANAELAKQAQAEKAARTSLVDVLLSDDPEAQRKTAQGLFLGNNLASGNANVAGTGKETLEVLRQFADAPIFTDTRTGDQITGRENVQRNAEQISKNLKGQGVNLTPKTLKELFGTSQSDKEKDVEQKRLAALEVQKKAIDSQIKVQEALTGSLDNLAATITGTFTDSIKGGLQADTDKRDAATAAKAEAERTKDLSTLR